MLLLAESPWTKRCKLQHSCAFPMSRLSLLLLGPLAPHTGPRPNVKKEGKKKKRGKKRVRETPRFLEISRWRPTLGLGTARRALQVFGPRGSSHAILMGQEPRKRKKKSKTSRGPDNTSAEWGSMQHAMPCHATPSGSHAMPSHAVFAMPFSTLPMWRGQASRSRASEPC